ncbi:inositol monophosphatase [halophilic archaeon]|nr:inositol monophosphatase [halophilic archaeon]
MDRKELVVRAASAGAVHALERFQTELEVSTKDSKMDYVTEADTQTQRRIIGMITDEFPDDTIVGEEEDALKEIPERGTSWVIDPIDGTTNFVRGIQLWATSVAVVRDQEPIAAANVVPAVEELYAASANGAIKNGASITVSETQSLDGGVVAPILPLRNNSQDGFPQVLREIATVCGDLRRLGSAQATLSVVATGALDAAIGVGDPNPWDTVAGAYMVEQAGGRVTDVFGEPWTPSSRGIIATNGVLHADIVAAVQRSLNGEP